MCSVENEISAFFVAYKPGVFLEHFFLDEDTIQMCSLQKSNQLLCSLDTSVSSFYCSLFALSTIYMLPLTMRFQKPTKHYYYYTL